MSASYEQQSHQFILSNIENISEGTEDLNQRSGTIWMEPSKQSAAHLQESLQGENRVLVFG